MKRTSEATHGGRDHGTPRQRPLIASRWFPLLTALVFVVFGAQLAGQPVSACDSLVIPSTDIRRCVISGDQSEIDAGNTVRVDRLSSDTVHWIAGHRTAHGATFRLLTDLNVGDVVHYRDASYEVVEYRLVDRNHPGDVAAWIESPMPTVLLQTSKNDTFVHVWRATEVAPPSQLPAPRSTAQFEPGISGPRLRADPVVHRTTSGSGGLKYM